MKIWELDCDCTNYNFLLSDIELGYHGYKALHKGTYWNWKKLKMVKDDELPLSDTLGSDIGIPIFSKKAVDVLMPLIKKHVRINQLNFEEEYYAVHVKTILKAINYEKSEFIRFDNSKRIMRFTKYSFKLEKVRGIPIFRVIDDKTSGYPFVSDEFKKLVEENHLTGFEFKLVWDSEEDE